MMYQSKDMDCATYLEQFQNMVEVIEHCGGSVGLKPHLIDKALDEQGTSCTGATATELDQAVEVAKDRYLACAFLMSADHNRFRRLVEDLENLFTRGKDQWPWDLASTYSYLLHWKQNVDKMQKALESAQDAVAFLTKGLENKEDEHGQLHINHGGEVVTKDKSKVMCYKCQELGHYAYECPKKGDLDGKTMCQTCEKEDDESQYGSDKEDDLMGDDEEENCNSHHGRTMLLNALEKEDGEDVLSFNFHLDGHVNKDIKEKLPSNWILLDNQSTVDVFCNQNLLKNMRKVKGTMHIHCNSGTTSTSMMGDLPGYGNMWYSPNGIANTLSLVCVKKKYRVTFDSELNNAFIVHKKDG